MSVRPELFYKQNWSFTCLKILFFFNNQIFLSPRIYVLWKSFLLPFLNFISLCSKQLQTKGYSSFPPHPKVESFSLMFKNASILPTLYSLSMRMVLSAECVNHHQLLKIKGVTGRIHSLYKGKAERTQKLFGVLLYHPHFISILFNASYFLEDSIWYFYPARL